MMSLPVSQIEGWCGIDEAGRGPLAGPVVAAAVILPTDCVIEGLQDSKRLSTAVRTRLAQEIREQASTYHIAVASVSEIDSHNILQATVLAMQRALNFLRYKPSLVVVDGNYTPSLQYQNQPLAAVRSMVGGDNKDAAIAAASILAKTTRDALMEELALIHQGYGFEQHKGYGTQAHIAALQRLGPCAEHRRSFAPLRLWLNKP